MTANTSQIELDTAAIKITREPVADNTAELIPKDAISWVGPIKINSKPAAPDAANWLYRFDDMVMIAIDTHDGKSFKIELQEITNQITWSGDLAGQTQAVDDINTWLAT